MAAPTVSLSQLSNILSSADAQARMRVGQGVYANTDLDAPQLWLDPSGTRRRNLTKGAFVGFITRFVLDPDKRFTFVEFADGSRLPITHAAVVSSAPPVEPDARERLVQLLQRDRVLAHQLLAIEDIGRRVVLSAGDKSRVQELNARLRARQQEVINAGWLAEVKQGFDRTWQGVLSALGYSTAPISGLPAIPIAGYALAAVLALGALVLWLSSREPQSVADFRQSLDLYNRLRAALPEGERKNLDQLITGTAEAARAQAQQGPAEKIGQLVILGLLGYLAVTQGPKLLKGGRRG